MSAMQPFQIRVQDDTLTRLDDLISYITSETELGRSKSAVTRSDVARIALDTGVDFLERRHQEVKARQAGMERAKSSRSAIRDGT